MTTHDLILRLTVPGNPIPKGRPRFAGGHAYTPKRTRQAETHMAFLALREMRHHTATDTQPRALTVRFYRADARQPDLDNLVKLVKDALNRIAWADDRQVSLLTASRHDSDPQPRTEIAVHRLVAT